jgi:microcystin-dependent protein
MFGGTFAPAGWMICQGQTLPISENEVLFNLIGTTYGGDGQSTFDLPNLAGRIPIHTGTGGGLSTYVIGQSGGVESVTLTTQQIPQHNHQVLAVNAAGTASVPTSATIMSNQSVEEGSNTPNVFAPYAAGTAVTLPAGTLASTGGSQPHENMQPILTVTYVISLFGVFPSQN